jgi:hypothetical protein
MSLPRDLSKDYKLNVPPTTQYAHCTMIDVLRHLESRAVHDPCLYPSKPCRADCPQLLDYSSSSTRSASLANAKTTSRRSVRFATDENGKISVSVVTFDRPEASCTSDLYWSRSEKRLFRSSGKRTASEQPAPLVDCLETTFSNCANKSSDPLRQDMQAMFQWANSAGRGLEHGVSDLLNNEQAWVVSSTVQYHQYRRLTAQCGAKLFDEELAKFSKQRTGPAREFAYKMALCDALVVRLYP